MLAALNWASAATMYRDPDATRLADAARSLTEETLNPMLLSVAERLLKEIQVLAATNDR